MQMLWQDLHCGVRMLGKTPTFTVVEVVTPALGIGANTALFSVVNAVLLNSLPYHQPNRLVALAEGIERRQTRFYVNTQTQLTADALTQERILTRLSSFFGLLALLLASLGLGGTMAYSVTRKTHEIGIRRHSAGLPGNVLRMVISQGLRLTFVGVVIGIVTAVGATRLISTMIYGVTANAPVTFVAVTVLLVADSFIACYVPAQKATRVDPLVTMR